jgi:hypothetical protein
MSQYDVAVIGGGPAGLSAALVLARARRTVVVVDAGKLRNAPARHMYGYLSRDGVVPAELVAAGRQEVTGYGGDIVPGTASDLVPDGRSGFWVLLADGNRISARRLLVTTGLRDELPDIPGLRDRWARDVLHCPLLSRPRGPRPPARRHRRHSGCGPAMHRSSASGPRTLSISPHPTSSPTPNGGRRANSRPRLQRGTASCSE